MLLRLVEESQRCGLPDSVGDGWGEFAEGNFLVAGGDQKMFGCNILKHTVARLDESRIGPRGFPRYSAVNGVIDTSRGQPGILGVEIEQIVHRRWLSRWTVRSPVPSTILGNHIIIRGEAQDPANTWILELDFHVAQT